MAKQASRDFPLSEANCVKNTNTATKIFKRGIFRHDRTKQAIIHTHDHLQKTRKKQPKKKKKRSLKEMGRFQRLIRSVPKETDQLCRALLQQVQDRTIPPERNVKVPSGKGIRPRNRYTTGPDNKLFFYLN